MGPIEGVKVVELAGIGPGPFTSMLLSDLGAEVVRIDRPEPGELSAHQDHAKDLLLRGRRSVAVNLKDPRGTEAVLELIDRADVLIDPFRPEVAERLGLGPDVCLERNPRLVYGRMTGWGQDGPLSKVAGHDINYVALAGPLAAMGRADSPPAPALNLIGDFGGGGMLLSFGILAALLERNSSGRGQVIDAAMLDGVATLFASIVGFDNMGIWNAERGTNFLDGGAPYYDTYETADGEFVSIGAIEPQFYALLLEKLELDPEQWPQADVKRWPEMKAVLSEKFKSKTKAEWCELLEGSDVCFAPVLSLDEARHHPQVAGREVYVEVDGVLQPGPVPRFDRTPGSIQGPPARPGQHSAEVLADWGLEQSLIDSLIGDGVVDQAAA